ncbi:hypothetical protein [Tomitella gaofuii]|uniref:DUF7172 family protein n=1 Tax=Tomitella gaofuii TaxID=2760083 RepID=UPI0015F9303F|nr:hypothetical protein [Tomitella gaofuii]
MSTRVCVDEHFLSTNAMTGFALGTLPRLVVEQRAKSAHDGDVKQLSDPVVFIDMTLRWRNTTDLVQRAMVEVMMAPRQVVVSNPNAIAITDAYGCRIGTSTDLPEVDVSLGETKIRARRNDFRAPSMAFQTTFDDTGGGVVHVCPGVVKPGEEIAFRYLATVSTPGNWRQPDTPRMSVKLNYAMLSLFTALEG